MDLILAGGIERTTYKLTQKVPGSRSEPGLITTLYLTSAEYDVLSALPAAALRKTQLSIPSLGVDVFEANLTGLVLGEAEFDDDAAMAAFGRPANAVAEVTHDPRLSGGLLANTTATALAMTLRDYGIDPDRKATSETPSRSERLAATSSL